MIVVVCTIHLTIALKYTDTGRTLTLYEKAKCTTMRTGFDDNLGDSMLVSFAGSSAAPLAKAGIRDLAYMGGVLPGPRVPGYRVRRQ